MALRFFMRYRNQIISAGIILVLGIFMRNIFLYSSRELNKLNKEKVHIEAKKKLIQEWDELNSKNKELEDRFFRKDTLVFKRFIEEKAKTAGISLEYLGPAHEDKTIYWKSTIGLKTASPYKDITEFIKYLENKNIKVEKVIIRNDPRGRKADIAISGITLKD